MFLIISKVGGPKLVSLLSVTDDSDCKFCQFPEKWWDLYSN